MRIVELYDGLGDVLSRRPEVVELMDLREPLLRLSTYVFVGYPSLKVLVMMYVCFTV